jgi:hypothetical protein
LTHIGTVQPVIASAEAAIKDEIDSVGRLAAVASNFPYYKFGFFHSITECSSPFYRYNSMWTRDVQDVIFAILMCGWLGGLGMENKPAEAGKLLTIEEVGGILKSESGLPGQT